MLGPSHLHVLLQVPEHVRAGLASGDLTLWGGTARDARGRIRALLDGGRGLFDMERHGTPPDLSPLTEAVGDARAAAHLASGIGLLNFGASAAGFAMVRQRLDAMTAQMRHAIALLAEVKEEAAWVGAVQSAVVMGEIDGALNAALVARRLGDRELFLGAAMRAFEVRRKLHHATAIMAETRRLVRRHAEFERFLRSGAVLAIV